MSFQRLRGIGRISFSKVDSLTRGLPALAFNSNKWRRRFKAATGYSTNYTQSAISLRPIKAYVRAYALARTFVGTVRILPQSRRVSSRANRFPLSSSSLARLNAVVVDPTNEGHECNRFKRARARVFGCVGGCAETKTVC